MSFYVYIIQSLADYSYYKGYTEHPTLRLQRHNLGESAYTKTKLPWKFVYLEELLSKRGALLREKSLKKYSHAQIAQLISSSKNHLTDIPGSSVG